jgi:hypothetical protein
MTNQHESDGFRSVDWDNLSEKRDWSGVGWTTAAVLVILLGFFGGMVFRTSLTGGPDDAQEMIPGALDTRQIHTAEQVADQSAEQASETSPGS